MDVLIIGAGGHGQVVADALVCASEVGDVRPIGFLDDRPDLLGERFLGLPVLGPVDTFREHPDAGFVVAIGDNTTRSSFAKRLLRHGRVLVSAVHPSAVIAGGVEIEPGAMICAGVVVNTGARIGESVILNTGCTVDHHCRVDRCAHIAPGANLGGDVHVGEGALVSIGAVVIPGRTIGRWAVIGAGGVVTRDAQPGTTVVGRPARPIAPREVSEEA